MGAAGGPAPSHRHISRLQTFHRPEHGMCPKPTSIDAWGANSNDIGTTEAAYLELFVRKTFSNTVNYSAGIKKLSSDQKPPLVARDQTVQMPNICGFSLLVLLLVPSWELGSL